MLCDPDTSARDDYAFSLPVRVGARARARVKVRVRVRVRIPSPNPNPNQVCEPDVRISARCYGNACRLINHSDAPNARLVSVRARLRATPGHSTITIACLTLTLTLTLGLRGA